MGLLDWLQSLADKRNMDKMFRKVYSLMTTDSLQNAVCPPEMQRLMARGGGVDLSPGARGDFGRTAINPIPVNGPLGELVYISNLLTSGGSQVIGHRLGSSNGLDIYEIVAIDGSMWDILFFNMYFMRKSSRLPSGYRASDPPQRFLSATNVHVNNFPLGFVDAMTQCTRMVLGIALVAPQFRDQSQFATLSRPAAHAAALKALSLSGATSQAAPPRRTA